MSERIKAFADAGDFDSSRPENERGMLSAIGDIVVLWALNVNANQVTFWMIFHIYSNQELLEKIRNEIKPHISLIPSEDSVKDSERLHIELSGLQKECPLLLGAFLETMRWESGATVYRYIYQDFTLTESYEDARIFGHEVPQTYLFQKGEYIVVPNGTHQSDERYFPQSTKFDAKRFWVQDEWEAKQPVEADIEDDQAMEGNWAKGEKMGKGEKAKPDVESHVGRPVKVDYKTMHPWGGGPTVCKGKKFAEGEVLTFVAAIIACWDMIRVDKNGNEISAWGEHPGHKDGTGAVVPASDVFGRYLDDKLSNANGQPLRLL